MSKLIDKLRLASQGAPQPLGFSKAAQSPPKPGMVLIASFTPASASRLADYTPGADAALWRISEGADITSLKKKSPAQPEIPWGLWLSNANREETETIAQANFDFVVFPLTASLAIMKENNGTGYILQVDTSISDSLARTIDNLPIDAVLIASEPAMPFLTWRHLVLAQRFATILDKSLLFTLPQSVTPDDLQMLWEAGVAGVIADAETSAIPTLRQQIDKLRQPVPRKRGKTGVLLPRITAETERPVEEEEDEEEE